MLYMSSALKQDTNAWEGTETQDRDAEREQEMSLKK